MISVIIYIHVVVLTIPGNITFAREQKKQRIFSIKITKRQKTCIVPSVRWDLLPPGTPTRRAYTATERLKLILD